ncbi:MAG: cell wall-active antibiotics response protein LiaF [Acidobacteriota bacterium]
MSAIEPVEFCPRCRHRAAGAKFCPACGANLAAVAEALADPGRTRRLTSPIGRSTLGVFNNATVSNERGLPDGHSAVAVFGGVTIDLTADQLPQGETRINIYTVFGSADILVFNDVGIRVTGATTFGNLKVRGEKIGNGFFSVDEYRSPNYEHAERRLHIDLVTIFGEVKIRR